jgi:trehalose 6-phosphate phosphatase
MPRGAVPAALAPLRADPSTTALFTDFDGTLSAIVDDPARARPLAGAVEVLGELAGRYARVGILSGRPVAFLEPFFPPRVLVAGLYGLETVVDGRRRDHPLGGAWREVVDDVVARSEAYGPEGMRVEGKGLSITLHYRGRPERAVEVQAWAEQQAARSGLHLRPARMSFELHPPIEVDKGTALLELVSGMEAVGFLGDDVGDLPAFDALDRLGEAGVVTVRVGVRSSEGDPTLLARADLVVDGPEGALEALRSLAEA